MIVCACLLCFTKEQVIQYIAPGSGVMSGAHMCVLVIWLGIESVWAQAFQHHSLKRYIETCRSLCNTWRLCE